MEETQSALGGRPGSGPGGGDAPRFAAEDLLAGRYRIVRFLAQGGMGEVYEAEDLELAVRVALKTVRSDIADRPGILERFKREIQLARKITHGNVCRIFDLGRHGDTTFLTMQLLDGATLTDRLARGPLPLAEAGALARQLASALEAAHRAGVIHRDLTANNVVLTAAGAVVTDFGLAHEVVHEETVAGTVAGTPAYMAPEQVEGGAVTPASDVYALGVVLFEAVTGKRPFTGATAVAVAARRLHERAPRARIDRRWDALLAACLERDPARRPAAADVPRLLAAPRRRRLLWLALPVATAAIAAFFLVPRARPPGPGGPRRAVAVLGFRNLGGGADAAWISTALAEMLGTELGVGEELRVIPGESVARAAAEIALPATDAYGPETLARLHAYLGADVVVLGNYVSVGGRLRVDVRVQETQSGATLVALAENGGDLLDIVARVGSRVRPRLGIAAVEREPGAFPHNAEATRRFAEGLDALRRHDPSVARVALEAAIAAEPGFALAHNVLSEAWDEMGYGVRAAAEAKRAFELSDGLAREERLLVEARYRMSAGAVEQAIEIYQTLWRFFPDNLEYGLLLAGAQTFAGHGQTALVTLAALRALPPGRGDSPLIDVSEAGAAASLGDNEHRLRAALEIVRKGRALGSRLAVSTGRGHEGWARYFLGDPEGSEAAFEDERRLAAEAGAKANESDALGALGLLRLATGDLRAARPYYEATIANLRDAGDLGGLSEAYGELAWLEINCGHAAAALRAGAEALRLADEIHVPGHGVFAHQNIGLAKLALGDLDDADVHAARARAIFESRSNPMLAAVARVVQAMVLMARGNLVAAEVELQAVLTFMPREYTAYIWQFLTDIDIARGKLDEARRLASDARQVRVATRQGLVSVLNTLQLAEIALDSGRLVEAIRLAQEAIAIYEARGHDDGTAVGLLIEARALARLDRPAALRALGRARAVAAATEWLDLKLYLVDATAELAARGGGAERAAVAPELTSAIAEAERAGLGLRLVSLRERAARLDAVAGRGRKRLDEVRREATAKGYLLVAGRAAE